MKNSETFKKARAGLNAAFNDSSLSCPVQYDQAVKPPFFMAVVKGSFRFFSHFAVPLYRYSPPRGIVLAGTQILES